MTMLIATSMQAAAAVPPPTTPATGIAMITGATVLVSSFAALGTAIRSAARSRQASESAGKAELRATAALAAVRATIVGGGA